MRIVISLLILLLTACAPYPHVGYYDMDTAIANAETPEEKAWYEKQLARFERDAVRADELILAKQLCKLKTDCIWFCQYRSINPNRHEPVLDTLEKKVTWYRRTRGSCTPYYGKIEW